MRFFPLLSAVLVGVFRKYNWEATVLKPGFCCCGRDCLLRNLESIGGNKCQPVLSFHFQRRLKTVDCIHFTESPSQSQHLLTVSRLYTLNSLLLHVAVIIVKIHAKESAAKPSWNP